MMYRPTKRGVLPIRGAPGNVDHEFLRILLPRTWVNKGKEKGWAFVVAQPFSGMGRP
jgi:hypothetical protein